MFKVVAAALTVFFLGTAVAAAATDPSRMQRYEAACSKAGFRPGEVNFEDCVHTLRQTAREMADNMKGSMSVKACTLAGFAPGSDALNDCISKLNTGIADDARDNG